MKKKVTNEEEMFAVFAICMEKGTYPEYMTNFNNPIIKRRFSNGQLAHEKVHLTSLQGNTNENLNQIALHALQNDEPQQDLGEQRACAR